MPSTGFAPTAGWLASSGAGTPSSREVPPESVGLDPVRLALVDALIERAVADSASPGAALVVGRYGKIVRLRGYGRIDWHPFAPPVTDSTLFDLASLTKAMGTATVATQLVREGRLDLDLPIHNYLRVWPGWGDYGRITARHLLSHTSGLPPGADLWPGARSREERIASLARLPVRTRPGDARVYSDVGMILLGAVLEAVTGSRLDDLLYIRVFEPLAMRDTRFNPLIPGADRSGFTLAQIAPTEFDTHVRKALVHGMVHDLNAWSLDGVAGHAGVFSSARDMAAFAQAILDATKGLDTAVLPADAFRMEHGMPRSALETPRAPEPPGSALDDTPRGALERTMRTLRGATGSTLEPPPAGPLGWDVPTGPNSAAGDYFSRSSFGHTGFTGTSIWIDPERDIYVVLLTNRLNPSARNRRHIQLRRDVHDIVQLAIADMPVVRRE
jgi:CubicO group peptidase (beta-lactamase class C family)